MLYSEAGQTLVSSAGHCITQAGQAGRGARPEGQQGGVRLLPEQAQGESKQPGALPGEAQADISEALCHLPEEPIPGTDHPFSAEFFDVFYEKTTPSSAPQKGTDLTLTPFPW